MAFLHSRELIDLEEGEVHTYNMDDEEMGIELAELNGLNVNGSFLGTPEFTEEHSEERFVKRTPEELFMEMFKSLKPGDIIGPGRFQNWLHPEFKQNHTNFPESFPVGFLRVNRI